MELCEKGVARNVGITNHQLSEGWDASEENNMYSTITELDELMIFFFGHTVGKTIGERWMYSLLHHLTSGNDR